jgi:hypothetical protein
MRNPRKIQFEPRGLVVAAITGAFGVGVGLGLELVFTGCAAGAFGLAEEVDAAVRRTVLTGFTGRLATTGSGRKTAGITRRSPSLASRD